MHPVVNHLIQLQELTLIRDEQKVAGGGAHLEQLDASIQTMTHELVADVRVQYEKLFKKDRVVIVPIAEGICASCAMKLPISLVQAVRLGREILSCPNCARMLFFPEAPVRRTGKTPPRIGPRKVGISRFSSHTLMIPRLESDSFEGAIRELAFKMEAEGFVDRADRLVEEALRREAIVSTVLDHGLAFPHVRGVEGGGLALAMGASGSGIKTTNQSRGAVKLVFFIVIPIAASAFYLKLLAGLAETFSDEEARKAILAEKDAEKMWKTLVKLTRSTIK